MITRTVYDNLNDEILQDYLVTVSNSYAKIHLAGILEEDTFSISQSAQLSNSMVAQGVEGLAKGAGKALLDKVFKGAGNTLSGLSSIRSTIKTYESSGEISFSLSFKIYPSKFGNPSSYKEIMRQISKLTQPELTSAGQIMVSHLYDPKMISNMLNPLGDKPSYKLFDGQLVCVTIGDWFKSCGLFCTGNNVSISTRVDLEGKPLYLTWSGATFTPYRILTADDTAKMIGA